MANTTRTPTPRAAMDSMRKTALVAGILYLITFISIPTLALFGPVKTDANYIISAGSDTAILVGGLLEVIVALAGIGTARRALLRGQAAAGKLRPRLRPLSRVRGRVIGLGVVSLLGIVALRQPGATGVEAISLTTVGSARRGYNGATLLGQSLVPALMAAAGHPLYRSGLVPRAIPAQGLIGAPVLLASTILTLFGASSSTPPCRLAALPIGVWEFSLGLYLTFKGFKASGRGGTRCRLDRCEPVGVGRGTSSHRDAGRCRMN